MENQQHLKKHLECFVLLKIWYKHNNLNNALIYLFDCENLCLSYDLYYKIYLQATIFIGNKEKESNEL